MVQSHSMTIIMSNVIVVTQLFTFFLILLSNCKQKHVQKYEVLTNVYHNLDKIKRKKFVMQNNSIVQGDGILQIIE